MSLLRLRQIAAELTTRHVPTARGGQWYPVQVADIELSALRRPRIARPSRRRHSQSQRG